MAEEDLDNYSCSEYPGEGTEGRLMGKGGETYGSDTYLLPGILFFPSAPPRVTSSITNPCPFCLPRENENFYYL